MTETIVASRATLMLVATASPRKAGPNGFVQCSVVKPSHV